MKSLKQLTEEKIASCFSLFVNKLERLPADLQESVHLKVSLGAGNNSVIDRQVVLISIPIVRYETSLLETSRS